MKRGLLVCVTGLDGSGKSTLTHHVVEELQSKGYDAVRTYGRYLPRLTYPAMWFGQQTVLADSDIEDDYETHQSAKEGLFENELFATMYELGVMFDYFPQYLYRVLLPLYQHDIVVCDRYAYDTLLTDLAGDVITTPTEAIEHYKLYSKFLREPELQFYIQIPPSVSMERKDDVPSIHYLEDRKVFYDTFADEHELIALDGTSAPDHLTNVVVNEIIKEKETS